MSKKFGPTYSNGFIIFSGVLTFFFNFSAELFWNIAVFFLKKTMYVTQGKSELIWISHESAQEKKFLFPKYE